MESYPIKFKPILQDKIWGGQKLKTVLNKRTDLTRVGESWEISSVENAISVVDNGTEKGATLVELIKKYKADFVGEKVYQQFGIEFPLLIKFIDATENLSIQLHPDDFLAKKRHNSFGKTEMWYVVDADESSELNVGFSKKMTPTTYQESVANKSILDVCNFEKVQAGDSYFIKSGLVHAIGKGCLIAEIQQTSDITYRIYDWDRVDDEGNERELHTNLAIEALDYFKCRDVKCRFEKKNNEPSEIVSCDYFTTNFLKINRLFVRDLSYIPSFVIYVCVGGLGIVQANGKEETIQCGETLLIPANVDKVSIESENLELLEVYIK